MNSLVDTSVLIDHTRGVAAARDALARAAHSGPLHSSEIVRAELLVLIREREWAAITPLLDVIAWHPIDREVAERAGELGRAWLPSHTGIDVADFIIAATAQLFEATLLTRNVKHFPMFPGLRALY